MKKQVLLAASAVLVPLIVAFSRSAAPAEASANDNRIAAGRRVRDTVQVTLVLQRATWRPDGPKGITLEIAAFGEDGKPATVPAPLLRVKQGTPMRVTVRNMLADSTVYVYGLWDHPAPGTDSLHVKAGESQTVTFSAGAPGTYLYGARIGTNRDDRFDGEWETTTGAFVVDAPGPVPPDRVFVMNVWSSPGDSTTREFRNALSINGRSWPHTERLTATTGDTIIWRVINGSGRGHPMHLHGFYFDVLENGDAASTVTHPASEVRSVVTETMTKFQTYRMRWVPDRDGNWLFHCHIGAHVTPEGATPEDESMDHGPAVGAGFNPKHGAAMREMAESDDAMSHMRGLILGINIAPKRGVVTPRRPATRTMHVDVREAAPRANGTPRYQYALSSDPETPWRAGGRPLFLTRGDATDIIVHNRTKSPTAIHWHGLELESWSDGVAGWSGDKHGVAHAIAPADSFIAHLSTPRAGTFMYHTHIGDVVQMRGGLYGPLIVLEPGQKFDPTHDHIILAGDGGRAAGAGFMVNGDSTTVEPLTLRVGETHRFRLISIATSNTSEFSLTRDSIPVKWQAVASDGADLPKALQLLVPAKHFLQVGQTADFLFTPTAQGEYQFKVDNGNPGTWRQKVLVVP